MALIGARDVKKLINLGIMDYALRANITAYIISKLIIRELEKSLKESAKAEIYRERVIMLENVAMAVARAYADGRLSRHMLVRILDIFFGGVPEIEEKRAQKGANADNPLPLFITLSPTQNCNLQCTGCYAVSGGAHKATLPFEVVDKILTQKKQLWGSFFTVISGGEPLAYRDDGKTLFDIFEKHSDQFFLMYTNGTLIDKDKARKFAELGNVTPAISVEGFEKETDARRGKGVYKKILRAMDNLREQGVMFGTSVTATRENADLVLSPEMVDFWMDKQGAAYTWMFQYMPIGRGISLDMLVTPEQRLRLYERSRELIHKERRFIVDFWNNGPLTRGCISAGRDFGYFYINWHGNIAPCVFAPYSNHNVIELFKEGKTLDAALESELFKGIRQWQKDYGYERPLKEVDNWIAPCPTKDNHDCFCRIREHAQARPLDEFAELAMEDEEYKKGLTEYGRKFKELSNKLWERDYLKSDFDKETI